MKMKQGIFLIVLGAAIVLATMAVFTVDQREQAIVLQLGQPVGDIKGPGLHFKIPVVQEVRRFDRRILSVDPPPAQMVIASTTDPSLNQESENAARSGNAAASGEPIVVDTFARYRISDPLRFMKTLRTIPDANQRLESIMNDATRTILGKRTLRELLSPERAAVMQAIRARVNKKIEDDRLGIEIVDIRIVRADLTPELRQSTVRRMISELKERATETRAKGEEKALEIRSTAEKERTVIMAEAERDAQILRGEGDREAIKTYAGAFNKDKDFYGFMRSMEAYRNTLANPDTRLILSPDNEFFRYFGKKE
ncbi:MAG: protease modulator HflC [Proteobacteria bacterium]|nr:protease modulator HflC [Pseudomonadota bacterium]